MNGQICPLLRQVLPSAASTTTGIAFVMRFCEIAILTLTLSGGMTEVQSSFDHGYISNSGSLAKARTVASEEVHSIPTSGFSPLDSDECDPQSGVARHSVLRMLLPGSESTSVRELVGRDGPEVRKQIIEIIRKDSSPPPSTDDINIWQLENCMKFESPECSISTDYRSSTMVLTGNGTESATAFHNLKLFLIPYLAEAKRNGLSAQRTADLINVIPIPAFIYNAEGKMVGQPRDISVHPSRITADQITEAWKDLSTKQMPTFADSASLVFSRTVGPGVRIAPKAPRLGEQVKIFGFPAQTQAWRAVGGTDSDGHAMYCSVGPTISIEAAAKRFNWNFESLSDGDKRRYQAAIIFTASASFGGMSGGAVFNERGELVATHSSGNDGPLDQSTANVLIPGIR